MKSNVFQDFAKPRGAGRGRGEKSRAAILQTAASLATTRGLEGLSIGDLASELGMSKSGLYAHFKSKEELQLATIDTAFEIFSHEVLQPAMAAPAGVRRLGALASAFLSHVHRRVFPGGCFFAAVAAELATRPGPVRDRVLQTLDAWHSLLEQCVRDAQRAGELDPSADVAQVVFEIKAMLLAANALFVIRADPATLQRGQTGINQLLHGLSPA